MGKMRSIFAAVAVVLLVLAMFWIGTYNSLVGLDENCQQAWGQVENVYQRRADLIPNLVSVVRGYAKHEKDVFTEVTEARSKVGSVNIAAGSVPDGDTQKEYLEAQKELGGALSRLLVVAENYPQLKADGSFRDLQSQIEGTENRVAVERKRFQETVQLYNSSVRRFPTSIVAGSRFPVRDYYKSDSGADKAPKVEF